MPLRRFLRPCIDNCARFVQADTVQKHPLEKQLPQMRDREDNVKLRPYLAGIQIARKQNSHSQGSCRIGQKYILQMSYCPCEDTHGKAKMLSNSSADLQRIYNQITRHNLRLFTSRTNPHMMLGLPSPFYKDGSQHTTYRAATGLLGALRNQ